MKLKNKVAIITGASSGIGEATARSLAREGARVVLAARRKERLETLKKEITNEGGEALVVVTDITNRSEVQHLVDQAIESYGNIDILVNNAGIMPLSFMKKLLEKEWDRMVNVNIKGVLNGIGAVLPQMLKQKGGHIVNVSSVAGRRLFPGGAVYCATKFAVSALSEGLRMELSPADNIKVTVIEPGAVTTELGESITDQDIIKNFEKMMANTTFLKSEDIAESIRYAVTQPQRVNVSEVLVMPTQQP